MRRFEAMNDVEDVELAELAALLRERHALDARIGRLLNRPVSPGHLGEWVASRIFGIALEASANAAGIDGHFTSGLLAHRTVNVKAYGKREGALDVNPNAPLDYYLVFTGPKPTKDEWLSSRGTLRPFCIDSVFLFDAVQLHDELEARGVKIGIATSVLMAQWERAEIYPRANNPDLVVDDLQRRRLALFAPE